MEIVAFLVLVVGAVFILLQAGLLGSAAFSYLRYGNDYKRHPDDPKHPDHPDHPDRWHNIKARTRGGTRRR